MLKKYVIAIFAVPNINALQIVLITQALRLSTIKQSFIWKEALTNQQ